MISNATNAVVSERDIVGFGVDDHQIRGLIRFIEMIIRESKNKGTCCRCLQLQKTDEFNSRRFKSLYVLNLS
jgi:hypothetical protein